MGADDGDRQLHELFARAQATRRRSRYLAARHHAIEHDNAEITRHLRAAWDRAEQVRALWLARGAGRLRYSAYARLEARLASMPVIEQAKGVIMAQCGWDEVQAFDALRRASQRENVKVRDLAAKIVASTVQEGSAPTCSPGRGEPACTAPDPRAGRGCG
jgi:hypothetical protein